MLPYTLTGTRCRTRAFDRRTILPHLPDRPQLQDESEENTSFISRSEPIQNLVPGEQFAGVRFVRFNTTIDFCALFR